MLPDYVLSFDPGGSTASWAYALSTVRFADSGNPRFGVVETGFVPVVEDLARPKFSGLCNFTSRLRQRYDLGPGGYTCDLVAERYVGRGHTGSLNEFIPFHLGYWSTIWFQDKIGEFRAIMASQWKLKAKKWNDIYLFDPDAQFENWWEDYYAYHLPTWSLKRTKSCERHMQDACAIGWYYWRFEKQIKCLPEGVRELIC